MKITPLLNLLAAAAIAAICPPANAEEAPKVGDKAPEVSGKDQDGKDVDLAKLYGEGPVFVFFYPKADTSGCTKQACSLRDNYESLTKLGVTVVGVSMDKQDDQKAFHTKHGFPYSLIADHEGKVVKAFGVPELRPGICARQAFIIKDGKIAWHDAKGATSTQGEEALKALDDLGVKAAEKKE
ncbi:MAG: peroxiredoxin [Verrucomicrobiales bacterium]